MSTQDNNNNQGNNTIQIKQKQEKELVNSTQDKSKDANNAQITEQKHIQKQENELIIQKNDNEVQKTKKNIDEKSIKNEDEIPDHKQVVRKQLFEMGFETNLVNQALFMYSNKDQAIQYIINNLDQLDDPIKNKSKQQKQGAKQEKMEEENQDDFQDVEEQYKMVFLARMDLKMGLGKIAAQVAHATLKAYKQMQILADKNELDQVSFFEWMESGQRKIVLKVNDEKQLLTLLDKAKAKKMNTCYIRDAGLTQIAAGSLTVGAIGPAISSQIDSITKHLKLL